MVDAQQHICVQTVERDGHRFECCHSWCLPWCRTCGRDSDYEKPCDGNLMSVLTERYNDAKRQRDMAQTALDDAGRLLNKERLRMEALIAESESAPD